MTACPIHTPLSGLEMVVQFPLLTNTQEIIRQPGLQFIIILITNNHTNIQTMNHSLQCEWIIDSLWYCSGAKLDPLPSSLLLRLVIILTLLIEHFPHRFRQTIVSHISRCIINIFLLTFYDFSHLSCVYS